MYGTLFRRFKLTGLRKIKANLAMHALNVVVHIGKRTAKARGKLLRKSQQLGKEGKSGETGKQSEVRLRNHVSPTVPFLCSKLQKP